MWNIRKFILRLNLFLQYICKQHNEEFPAQNNAPWYTLAGDGLPPEQGAVLPASQADNLNGCFNKGPGALIDRRERLTLNGGWFVPNVEYTIGVVGKKTYDVDGRKYVITDEQLAVLEVKPGEPPAVRIECTRPNMCKDDVDHFKVTANVDVLLRCVCDNCDANEPIDYKWKITRNIDFGGFIAQMTLNDQRLVSGGCCFCSQRTILKSAGTNQQVLTLKSQTWTDGIKSLAAECTVYRQNFDPPQTGKASTTLAVSE